MPSAQDILCSTSKFYAWGLSGSKFLSLLEHYQNSDLVGKVPACMVLTSAY